MLDDYKEQQPLLYNLLVNSLKNNKLSHAYLFDINDNSNAYDIIIAFVKFILCPENYTNLNSCKNCSICERINSNNHTEFRIIEPNGMWIKKEQLLEIQEDYAKIGIEGKYRVYIIKECEKMNKQSANSILKFLEEPSPNVIAILVTNNVNKMLDTIVSRCQYIKLEKNELSNNTIANMCNFLCKTEEEKEKFLLMEKQLNYGNSLVNFILFYEKNKYNTIIYIKDKWDFLFNSKEVIEQTLNLMIIFYFEVIKYKISNKISFFLDYKNEIDTVSKYNDLENLIKKVEILTENVEYLKFNLNTNLFINMILIELGGEYVGNSCC